MLFLPILAAVFLFVLAGIQLKAASRALTDQQPDDAGAPGTEPPELAVLTAPTWAVSGTWRGPDDDG
jgi:hypothetical protein